MYKAVIFLSQGGSGSRSVMVYDVILGLLLPNSRTGRPLVRLLRAKMCDDSFQLKLPCACGHNLSGNLIDTIYFTDIYLLYDH